MRSAIYHAKMKLVRILLRDLFPKDLKALLLLIVVLGT